MALVTDAGNHHPGRLISVEPPDLVRVLDRSPDIRENAFYRSIGKGALRAPALIDFRAQVANKPLRPFVKILGILVGEFRRPLLQCLDALACILPSRSFIGHVRHDAVADCHDWLFCSGLDSIDFAFPLAAQFVCLFGRNARREKLGFSNPATLDDAFERPAVAPAAGFCNGFDWHDARNA